MSEDLIVIECFDIDNRIATRERFVVTDTRRRFTLGRSLLADVTLADTHVAGLHAAIEITPDGRIMAADLGSINGLLVGKARHRENRAVELPHRTMQIGRTRVQVRTSWESLPPEKSVQKVSAGFAGKPVWLLTVALIGFLFQIIYTAWLDAPTDLIGASIGAIALKSSVIAGWIAFCALLSRILRGQWRWLENAAVALTLITIYWFMTDFVAFGWFTFSLPGYGTALTLLEAAMLTLLFYFHLRQASTIDRRIAFLLAAIIPVLAFGYSIWQASWDGAQNVNLIPIETRIYPPGLRLTSAETIGAYIDDVADLRETANKKRDNLPPTDDGIAGIALIR